ncbi:glycosyltransferase family 4 protein [Klebsiella variicola]|uniref:glycosyltransferase family 4 protein n=1 Tax=Klebsiella variicola TaxID=244366 RepID=UPI003F5C496F
MGDKMGNIIFDTRWIGEHGIGRFAKELFKIDGSFLPIKLTGNPASKFDVLKLTIYRLANRKDYFFSPGYSAPLFFLDKTFITVHDLNHIDVQYNSSWLKKVYYKLVLKRACKKSKVIFTVSNFTKERIVQWSGRDSKDIVVVGNGVSQEFNSEVEPYVSDSQYILMVGNRKQHKNEKKGVEAFLKSSAGSNIKLLMTGESSADITNLVNEYNASDRVVFLGKVDENTLASLYKGAICLFFPSLYEGFGLPIIESMACGTPVITSNITALPEVTGDAGLYVDPYDLQSMINGINKMISDSKLRTELSERGLIQVRKYSWDMTRSKISLVLNKYNKKVIV